MRPVRAEAASWLGFPALPPASLAAGTNRARQRLRRTGEAGPGFVVALERALAVYDNVVLGVLCRNRIPEALTSDHLTAREIAARLPPAASSDTDAPWDVDAVDRILRYAAVRGFVARDRRGRYRANAITRRLRADAPGSAQPWVEFLTSRSMLRILAEIDVALHGGEPCRAATGTDFFTFANDQDPALGAAFNRAMAQSAHIQALLLADAVDLDAVRTVVDVGGGTGAAARVLLRHHPDLTVTVLDLPAVVGAIEPASGLRASAGDFFESIPPNADLYLLLAILHDWGDADATRILGRVREAMGSGGRAVVVDATIDHRTPQELIAATDLLMLTLTAGGRERTAADWQHVVNAAGLRIHRHQPLATGFSAYELVAD